MNKIKSVLHSVLSKIEFHVEKLGLWPTIYPKIITQKSVDPRGISFEVHNLTEVNRVRFLDDEEDFLSELLKSLDTNDVFFDIGACIGVFSLHSANRCKHVIAFEPEPGFRQHLKRNIEINNISNIAVLPYAISDRTSVITLFTDGTDGKSPSLENNNFQHSVDVETRTVSELVLQDGLPCPTVLKMDIEGAEILAMRGMKEILSSKPPRLIFLELHPVLLTHFSASSQEVLLLLEQAGYKVRMKAQRDEQVHYIFCLDRLS